jgi:hypothetical protein
VTQTNANMPLTQMRRVVTGIGQHHRQVIYAQYSANVLDGLEDFCHLYLPASCVLVDYEIASRIASYAKSTR